MTQKQIRIFIVKGANIHTIKKVIILIRKDGNVGWTAVLKQAGKVIDQVIALIAIGKANLLR